MGPITHHTHEHMNEIIWAERATSLLAHCSIGLWHVEVCLTSLLCLRQVSRKSYKWLSVLQVETQTLLECSAARLCASRDMVLLVCVLSSEYICVCVHVRISCVPLYRLGLYTSACDDCLHTSTYLLSSSASTLHAMRIWSKANHRQTDIYT